MGTPLAHRSSTTFFCSSGVMERYLYIVLVSLLFVVAALAVICYPFCDLRHSPRGESVTAKAATTNLIPCGNLLSDAVDVPAAKEDFAGVNAHDFAVGEEFLDGF